MGNENSTFTGMEQKYPKSRHGTVAVGGWSRPDSASAKDTSEHGTQESSYHGTLTQNTELDESWRNTGGSGGVALLVSAGSHKQSSFTNRRSWKSWMLSI